MRSWRTSRPASARQAVQDNQSLPVCPSRWLAPHAGVPRCSHGRDLRLLHRETLMIMKTMLVAMLVLGSTATSFAAPRHYSSHGYQTRNVSLSPGYGSAREGWMDHASRSWSGGGY